MKKLEQLLQTHCPNGVEFRNLENCCKILDNKRKPITRSAREYGNYPYYGANGIQDYVSGYIFDGTFVLVGEDGSVMTQHGNPVVNWAEGKIWVNNHAHIITGVDGVLLRYLYHYLQTVNVKPLIHGNIPKLTGGDFKEIQIPVPPLPVQEEIVRILDKFTELEAELAQELAHRKLQYTFYRDKLLSFENPIVTKSIGEICAIKRGKVISKDYIREHSGIYPVYSSQTENDGVLGLIDSYDYDGEYLTWTTDGANAGTVFHRTGKFNITNVCGLLKPIDASVNTRYLYYILGNVASKHVEKGMGNPKLMSNVMESIKVPIPSLDVQQRLVKVLDNFDSICSDLSIGLPAEIAAREKAYIYYRDFLLNYTANGLDLSRAEQSRAEQSRAEQSRAEQSRAEQKLIAYVFGPRKCA